MLFCLCLVIVWQPFLDFFSGGAVASLEAGSWLEKVVAAPFEFCLVAIWSHDDVWLQKLTAGSIWQPHGISLLIWYRACYVGAYLRTYRRVQSAMADITNSPNLNLSGEVKGRTLGMCLKYPRSTKFAYYTQLPCLSPLLWFPLSSGSAMWVGYLLAKIIIWPQYAFHENHHQPPLSFTLCLNIMIA